MRGVYASAYEFDDGALPRLCVYLSNIKLNSLLHYRKKSKEKSLILKSAYQPTNTHFAFFSFGDVGEQE